MANAIGSLEYHKNCLDNLCRLCADRAQTYKEKSSKPAKLCAQYTENIKATFDIDIIDDDVNIHPTKLCTKCYKKMFNAPLYTNPVSSEIAKNTAATVDTLWTVHNRATLHDINQCAVCLKFWKQSKASRPRKIKRGPKSAVDNVVKALPGNASTTPSVGDTELTHLAGDQELMQVVALSPPASQSTPNVCHQSPGPANQTCHDQGVQTTPSIDTTLNASLNRSIGSPLSRQEESLHTRLTKRKLTYGKTDTITCRTGGQPLVLKRLSKPRKSTATASTHVIKRRANQLGQCRNIVAGDGSKPQEIQQTAELRSLSKPTRIRICAKAGIQHRTSINKHLSLAMKSSLNLTWSQMRKQKRFLKSLGVNYTNEKSERAEQQKLLDDNIILESVNIAVKNDSAPESKAGFVVEQRPLVKVGDISKFVKNVLDQFAQLNKLTWSDNFPRDEIWIKIGGDHGGTGFKMCLQVLNVHCPNSPANTFAIMYLDGKDYRDNLVKVLLPLRDEITQLHSDSWQGKRFTVFLCGDYDFLSKMYGLSGAKGTHCCLWCSIKSKQIQLDPQTREPITRRKLSSIKVQQRRFETEGDGKKSKAASYENCIYAPIWDIRIQYVCPPYLHILLGVIKRHHDLLETACSRIDRSIALFIARCDTDLSDSVFDRFVKQQRNILELKAQKNKIIEKLERFEDVTCLAKLATEERRLKAAYTSIDQKIAQAKQASKLGVTSGPVSAHLETVLQKHGISVQAYHGRSFVGNHCHKYLRLPVYTQLCQAVIDCTLQYCDAEHVVNMAETTCQRFLQLNQLYSEVHSHVSHGRPTNEKELGDAQQHINHYLAYVRDNFPMKVLPKMHFLEDHVVPWMRRWGHGMAFHGEQAVESIHAEFNRLHRAASGIRNRDTRCLSVMKAHHMKCSPTIQSYIVQPKKRCVR